MGCLCGLCCGSMRVMDAGISGGVWAVRVVGRWRDVCHIFRMVWIKDQAPLGGGQEEQNEEHGF